MIVSRFACVIPLLMIALFCEGSHGFWPQTNKGSNNARFRDGQCPNAEDIAPCICDDKMNMNCTGVVDEQQLYDVFHSYLPSTAFNSLYLDNTPLKVLSDDVFGDATFWAVFASDGSLSSIGRNTFNKSKSTLEGLILYNNQLTDFPFEIIQEYSILQALNLRSNPIQSCPTSLQSETMVEFHLADTFCHDIHTASLDLPELKVLYFENTAIDSIGKDAFVWLSDIRQITMYNTGLEVLKSHQFAVTSPNLGVILLYDNFIEHVEPNAFRGIQSGQIILSNNKLTSLPEGTWKSVLDAGVNVIVDGNDFTCGCDIAWLVLEPSYHPQVASAMCHSGEMLINLDPSYFENNC